MSEQQQTESLELSVSLAAPPERVYRAWLDSSEHSAFTRAPASIEPVAYGRYSVHDGYVEGITLELDANRRIVQTWRTSEFPKNSMDSRLEVVLEPEGRGTRMTLRHTDIPAGQSAMYESAWRDHYLTPIKTYFASSGATVRALPTAKMRTATPKKKVAAKKKAKAAPKKKVKAAAKKKPAKKKVAKKKKPAKKKVAKKKKPAGKK
jgi:uncharacterized protein YndB with AHSA1/START domain